MRSVSGSPLFGAERRAEADARNGAGEIYDALVVGGGLAGSSLAISLAEAGRSVLLIEKTAAAHPKVCGEFLSHEALRYLAALKIDLDALGAVPIESVRLAGRQTLLCARLPFRSLSVTRERLDEALLRRAHEVGVCIRRGCRVRSLAQAGKLWTAESEAGERWGGKDAFLSTGKHDLYGWKRPNGKQGDLLAFKMYWRLAPAEQVGLDRHVELVLFPGGYAGLQPVEGGLANLCLLVRRRRFREVGGTWPALLAHILCKSAHMAKRLTGAIPQSERPLSLSSIPYGYVRTRAEGELWRLGDQSAVIPSFAGDGMSIALHSARLAAAIYLAGGTQEQFQTKLARTVQRQVSLATLLSKGLVYPLTGSILTAAARVWPVMLGRIASSTRIRAEDLLC